MAKRGMSLSSEQWELLLTELAQMSSMELFSLQPPQKYDIYEADKFVDFELVYAWKSLDQRKRYSLIKRYVTLIKKSMKMLRLAEHESRRFNERGVFLTGKYYGRKDDFYFIDYPEMLNETSVLYEFNLIFVPDCLGDRESKKVIVVSFAKLPRHRGRTGDDYLGFIRLARVNWKAPGCGLARHPYSWCRDEEGLAHCLVGGDVLGQIDRDRYGKKIVKL